MTYEELQAEIWKGEARLIHGTLRVIDGKYDRWLTAQRYDGSLWSAQRNAHIAEQWPLNGQDVASRTFRTVPEWFNCDWEALECYVERQYALQEVQRVLGQAVA